MAKSNLRPELDQKLDAYKKVALTQTQKLDKLISEHRRLMQKRLGLVQTKKLSNEKRTAWNRQAAEWRAQKPHILEEARKAHLPHYQEMMRIAGTLDGREKSIFLRTFHTLNGYFVKSDGQLRQRNLEDVR